MGERPQAFSHILFVGKVYYSNRSDNKKSNGHQNSGYRTTHYVVGS